MSIIIYVPAKEAREMLASGDYVSLPKTREWCPSSWGAQTYKTRLCENGKPCTIVFWQKSEFERAKKLRAKKTRERRTLNMNYGIPYLGSKNKIATKLVSLFPSARVLIEPFMGGGAITHASALSGKFEEIFAGDITQAPDVFKQAVEGEFSKEKYCEWISREQFFARKDNEAWLRICYSFGNDQKSYLYGKTIEPYKRAIHYAICFDEWKEFNCLCSEVADYVREALSGIKSIKCRRIRSGTAVVERLKQIGDWNLVANNPLYNSCQKNNSLERLQSLQSLESLQRLQSLESLQGLKDLITTQPNIILRSCVDYRAIINETLKRVPVNDCIIYCDPPYEGTAQYLNDFNHAEFWQFVRDLAKQGARVFVSEYNAPEDFKEVWSANKRCTLSQTNNSLKTTEKLFTI